MTSRPQSPSTTAGHVLKLPDIDSPRGVEERLRYSCE
jgi:hypothetical protein